MHYETQFYKRIGEYVHLIYLLAGKDKDGRFFLRTTDLRTNYTRTGTFTSEESLKVRINTYRDQLLKNGFKEIPS